MPTYRITSDRDPERTRRHVLRRLTDFKSISSDGDALILVADEPPRVPPFVNVEVVEPEQP